MHADRVFTACLCTLSHAGGFLYWLSYFNYHSNSSEAAANTAFVTLYGIAFFLTWFFFKFFSDTPVV